LVYNLFLSELSKAQRSFANVLNEFRLECIGEIDTDDEMEIGEQNSYYGILEFPTDSCNTAN
jgi:hypothetical protein